MTNDSETTGQPPRKVVKPNPPSDLPVEKEVLEHDVSPTDKEDPSKLSLADHMARSSLPVPLDPKTITSTSTSPLPESARTSFHDAVNRCGAVCVLLAAGQGTRFKSDLPKVIHPFAGKPLAQHALDAAAEAEVPVIVVVGHAKELVVPALSIGENHSVVFVHQEMQLGTGHGVYVAKFALPETFDGALLVSYADNPGVDADLLKALLARHKAGLERGGETYSTTVLTGSRASAGDGAAAYGRIVRKKKDTGHLVDIVEKKTIARMKTDGTTKSYEGVEWSAQELNDIDEFNSGIVCARAKPYLTTLGNLTPSQTKIDPPKYEYYATDFVKLLYRSGKQTEGYMIPPDSTWRLEGANTVEELEELEEKFKKRLSDKTEEAKESQPPLEKKA